jgi:transcriptional regulator with XRE-family HTH domain
MGRTIDDVIAELPKASQRRIDSHYRALKQEVESLRQLRKAAGKAQADIAAALKIRQPSVSKIERQADMYISTLRNYVEAIGGELELVVRLPSRPAIHLQRLGDILPEPKPGLVGRPRRLTKRAAARS